MVRPTRWTVISSLAASVAAVASAPAVGQAPGTKSAVAVPLDPPSAQVQTLDIGSVVTGTLEQGDLVWPEQRYYDNWNLVGRGNETVTVDLVSDDFDAVLYLVGSFQLTYDDDGAGGCGSRIRITFPVDGTYRLYVSSYRREEAGSYTIRVTDRPGQPSGASCERAGGEPSTPLPPPNETCDTVIWMEWLSIATESGGGLDFTALTARERSACEMGFETRSGETWPTGQTARDLNAWYYPNGQLALQRSFGGATWYYPNGQLASMSDFGGPMWYYPNGQLAMQRDTWHLPDGRLSSPAGIIEASLERLPTERAEELISRYRDSTGDFQTLLLVVMASEASR